jgi:hypothetical protein
MSPKAAPAGARLSELEAVLAPLVPALERLHDAQLEQHRVVVAGDLGKMVAINTAIEETSARIALLEQRRMALQAELEAELGVQGLRAVLKAAAIPPSDRQRLGQQLVQVARLVRTLREQGRRNADLLQAAIGAAGRTRQVLERLSGAKNTYDPVKARRFQAAQRARAGQAGASPETTPPAMPGQAPALAGEDAASSAPEAAPRKEAP